MEISLFIPTLNAMTLAKETFVATLKVIKSAQLNRVLIIDSSSSDDTVATVRSFGFESMIITAEEFDHGATRQYALEMLKDSSIIVYLTQDVLIPNVQSLNALITVLVNDSEIAGVYGRQIAYPDANLLAKHLRKFNYRLSSYVRKFNDRFIYGMRCVFSSDSFAAYKVEALNKIGGFPSHVIMGEDVYVFAKFLHVGYQVAYAADAVCMHSHNYTVSENFKRYFDIGVFHHAENWILQEFGTANKDGLKFVVSELCFLFPYIWYFPRAIINTLAKYVGYCLGRNYDQLGVRLCRRCSMNKKFWW